LSYAADKQSERQTDGFERQNLSVDVGNNNLLCGVPDHLAGSKGGGKGKQGEERGRAGKEQNVAKQQIKTSQLTETFTRQSTGHHVDDLLLHKKTTRYRARNNIDSI